MDLKDIELIAIVAAAACKGYSAIKEYNARRWWVRELNTNRNVDGFFSKNFERIKNCDPEHFFKMTRMNNQTFDLLFVLLEDSLPKTSKRKPIESLLKVI